MTRGREEGRSEGRGENRGMEVFIDKPGSNRRMTSRIHQNDEGLSVDGRIPVELAKRDMSISAPFLASSFLPTSYQKQQIV